MTLHLDDDALEAYAMGILPEGEQAGLEQHLLVCEDCRERLVEADRFLWAITAAARDIRIGRSDGRQRAARWLATATVLLLALAEAAWGRFQAENPRPVTVWLETSRGGGAEWHGPSQRDHGRLRSRLPAALDAHSPHGSMGAKTPAASSARC